MCATVALWQTAPAAGATTTIGNSLANPNNGSIGCGPPCTVFQEAQPGATLVSPFDGTIISWSYRSTDSGAMYQLRVLHPVGNGQLQGAGTSQIVSVPDALDTVKGPFAVSLPIRAGDKIGLRVVSAPSTGAPLFVSGSASDVLAYFASPDLADGATATPISPGSNQQILVQATVQPNPPTCRDVSASTPHDQVVSIPLSCSEVAGAPLTYSIDSGPSHGTASLSGSSITYTPNGSYSGSDTVTYHASSSNGTAASRTVSIAVAPATPLPPAPPLPPPVLAKSVNLVPIQGQVFVKLPAYAGRLGAVNPLIWEGNQPFLATDPGTRAIAAQKGQGFIPLAEARQVPVGTLVDTTAGVARLTSATARLGQVQTGDFQSGIFRILQSRGERGLTELRILDARSARTVCSQAGKANASRKLSKSVLGLLKANARGRFRTRGQFSSTTVRGTEWGVRDRCDGTLTRVQRGVVVVRDFRLRRNIIVRAGKTYLAKAR